MRAAVSILMLAVAGCVVPHTPGELASRERPQDRRVHTELVRGMLQQGQFYAALAHIEEVERDGRRRNAREQAELRLLRGEALQALGRNDDAAVVFRQLVDGPFSGQALHGLGLIAVKTDLSAAVRYFNAAVAARPTDAELRNDLGYALMMAGRLAEARHHLATAAELDPGTRRAAHNLVISYLLVGKEGEAASLAGQIGIDASGMAELRREVDILRRVIRTRAGEFESKSQSAPG